MKEKVEKQVINFIEKDREKAFSLNTRLEIDAWVEGLSLDTKTKKEAKLVTKGILNIFKRDSDLKELNRKKYSFERVTNSCLKNLKGVYPVGSSSCIGEILNFILYYQTRLESFVQFDYKYLEGKTESWEHDFHHVPQYLIDKIIFFSTILIHECNWREIKYKAISDDVTIIRVDSYPQNVYIPKKIIRGLDHKTKIDGKNKLYDNWFLEVLKKYQIKL